MIAIGQYYIIANLDRKEYLSTHPFNSGSKLLEFSLDSCGPLTGLAVLLADGCGRGGGDLRYFQEVDGVDTEVDQDPIVGCWKGDRIVVAGDYADAGQYGVEAGPEDNIYESARKDGSDWRDISAEVIEAMAAGDSYLKSRLLEREIIDQEGKYLGPPYLREHVDAAG